MSEIKYPPRLGENVAIMSNAFVDDSAQITIGDNTFIGGHVKIYRHHHNEGKHIWINKPDEECETIAYPMTIGKHVFIGYGAFILPSCMSIGDYALIGAMSVVTKNVPACEVWAGHPARRIRTRLLVDGVDKNYEELKERDGYLG